MPRNASGKILSSAYECFVFINLAAKNVIIVRTLQRPRGFKARFRPHALVKN